MVYFSETVFELKPANDADATLAPLPGAVQVPQADKPAIVDTLTLVPRIEVLFIWSSLTDQALTGVISVEEGVSK